MSSYLQVFLKPGLPGLTMLRLKVVEYSPLLQSYLRHLSRFSENFNTLCLMVFAQRGIK